MMKTLQKQSRFFSLLLIIVMLFQSCQVYKSKSSTLDEAVASNHRVKIHTKSGEKMKFKKVFKIDTLYYGLQKKDTIQIDALQIDRIRLKNRSLSTIYTVLISTTGVFVLVIIVGAANYGR